MDEMARRLYGNDIQMKNGCHGTFAIRTGRRRLEFDGDR